MTGSGDLEAFSFTTDTVRALLEDSGDAEITVNDLLDARLSGSGDLSFRGNPELRVVTEGSGEVMNDN